MDPMGRYVGCIEFSVTVKPSLVFGCEISAKGNFGRSENGHKDYILDELQNCLTHCADWKNAE